MIRTSGETFHGFPPSADFSMTKPLIRVLLVEDDAVDRMACRRALARNSGL